MYTVDRDTKIQATLVVVACSTITLATVFGKDDSFWVKAAAASAVAIVAPLATAWDRRAKTLRALGLPLATVLVANACFWISTLIEASTSRTCREVHLACEGYSIILMFWPFVTVALALAALVIGGLTRLVAHFLSVRRT